jgi:hypothetical protein
MNNFRSFYSKTTIQESNYSLNLSLKKSKCDYRFHNFVTRIVQNIWFDGFIMSVIFLNAILMGVETSYRNEDLKTFMILNFLFTLVYSFEFLLKIYSQPKIYFKILWNWLDFINLVIAFIDLLITYFEILGNNYNAKNSIAILRAMRAFKAFRILRTVSFVKGLQVIVTTLLYTISNSVINVTIIIILVMFIFSLIGNSIFQNEDWNSLKNAMWTLFRFICADEWPEIQKNLESYSGSRVFTMFFVFIGNFIFANIFIGLIIMNISDAQQEHQRTVQAEEAKKLEEKKANENKNKNETINKLVKHNKLGNLLTSDDMGLLIENYRRHFKSKTIVESKDLSANLIWIKLFAQTLMRLDNTMFILKNLHFEMANVLASIAEERLIRSKC